MPKTNENYQLDVKCVQCDYELRGITKPVCPECGWEYGNLKSMMADCGKIRLENASDRFIFHCVLLGSAISNVIAMALVLGHYALALHLGNPWLPDPKSIGLFRLPTIGSFIHGLATLTWIFTPAVLIIAIAAFAQVLRLGSVSRKWRSLRRCDLYSIRIVDWCSIGIVLISSFIVLFLGRGVTKWLFD